MVVRGEMCGSRHGMDPRIQDVVLLAPNFTTNPYDPLFKAETWARTRKILPYLFSYVL